MSSPPSRRIHFGRGGSGNTTSANPSNPSFSPSHASDAFPKHKPRRFSTGIGGHANITPTRSSAEETSSLLRDHNAPGLVLSSSPHTMYGITGAGNMYKMSEADIEKAKANNDGLGQASLASLGSRKSSKVDPNEDSSDMSESPRRGSLAASVRGLLGGRGSKP